MYLCVFMYVRTSILFKNNAHILTSAMKIYAHTCGVKITEEENVTLRLTPPRVGI